MPPKRRKALTPAERRVKKDHDLTDDEARTAIKKGYVWDIGIGPRGAADALAALDHVAGKMHAEAAAESLREGRKELKQGRRKEALEHLSRAIRYAELKPQATPWKFRLERAQLYETLGETRKMKIDLRVALKLAPPTWSGRKRAERMLATGGK